MPGSERPVGGSPGDRYSAPAVALHWIVAAATIFTIGFAWWMTGIPKDPPGQRAAAFNLHKSIGISIFILMLLRTAWRISHPPPPLPPMPRWQAIAAQVSHRLLYACLFIMPLAGFTSSQFSGRPILFFGLALPRFVAADRSLASFFNGVHVVTSWILVALIVVHVLAALHHQFVARDGLFARMSLRRRDGPRLGAETRIASD